MSSLVKYIIDIDPKTCEVVIRQVGTKNEVRYSRLTGCIDNSLLFDGKLILDYSKIYGVNSTDGLVALYKELCDKMAECKGDVEIVKEQYIDPRPCTVYSLEDKKFLDPIELVQYFDCVNNKFVAFANGVVPSEENIFNLENFIKMNVVGFPNTETPKNSTGKIPFSLCGELAGGTLADVLAELLLDPDFVLPDGTPPTGFTELSIQAEYKGQTCKGTVLVAQGATVGTMTLDGGEGWCKVLEYKDLDCDTFAQCINLATILEIPVGAGVKGYAVGVACDADDTDASVTV